jgi:uncharacterized protein YggT (Ycf19 family)
MTAIVVTGAALHGAALAVRVLVGLLAILLVIRSLGATYLPVGAWRFLRFLNELTEMIAEPVRALLPWPLGSRKPDYASLVAAICLLLIGFGVNELFLLLARSL